MISRKTLVVLGLAAAAAIVVAVLLSREQSGPAPAALFPDLAARVRDVSEVRLKSPQGEVTLARRDGQWVVRQKGDYPASSARLRELFQGLAGLSAPEPRTRDPRLYERVGLDPERGERPARLDLFDGAGKTVASLWIGKTRALVTDMQRNEYFVRRGDEPQVWRVEGRLPGEATPVSWIEKQVLALDRARIRAVAAAPHEGQAFRVSRASAETPEFALEGLAAGEKVESPLRINSLVSAIQNLSADDVLGPEPGAALQEQGRVAAETFDGLKVELQLLAGDAKRFVRMSAAGTGADTVMQEAARLNERWRNRTYQLAEYQSDSLFAKRADLVPAAGGAGAAAPGKPPATPSKPRR